MQLKKFSPKAQKVLIQCKAIAQKNHNMSVEPEHLALALTMTLELEELLSKKNVEHKALESELLQLISKLLVDPKADPHFSPRAIQALSAAEAHSIKKGHELVSIGDMFLSLVENREKYGALGNVLAKFFLAEETRVKNYKKSMQNLSDQSLLLSVTDNINELIKNDQLDPVFGRGVEIERLIQVLSRKTRNSPILIGEPGVGRTSIVYGLAKRIVLEKIPSHLISKEILSLDIGALISGTTLRGQFEERMRRLFLELSERQGHYILFIRDLSLLMGAGGEGASDAANMLKPALERGLIQLVGLVTPDAYKKRIERDPSFERYFQPIWVSEPSLKECREILSGLKGKYEQFHGVFIDDEALLAAIELGSRHLSGRVLPELALDVLDEACSHRRILIDEKPLGIKTLLERKAYLLSKAASKKKPQELATLENKLQKKLLSYERELAIIEAMRALKDQLALADDASQTGRADLEREFMKRHKEFFAIKASERLIDPWVKRDDIAAIISSETGIPVQKMLANERDKLSQMESLLHENVIGQPEAIAAVANAIRRARVGLKDPKRPIGSFLFLGPTGVGKTELARSLTNFLFDDERAMVRFDMSEFMERHAVMRLIGSPPGYQSSEEGGQLTEKVRRKPYAVVLFDEIEKAHQDVLNILLQVLDEGRLTDSLGHLVTFANTVVIMTSNLGSEILLDNKGLGKDEQKSLIMEQLLLHLRPELINRIDEIVMFNAIDEQGIRGILELMLEEVTARIAHEGFRLEIGDEVKNALVKAGYSKEFGARPLKRAIQRLIENPLSMALVQESFKKGDLIQAQLSKDGAIEFRKDTH